MTSNHEQENDTLAQTPSFGCPYWGLNRLNQIVVEVWKNQSLGSQVELMSHYCINGSASHLTLEAWNKLCFPTYQEANSIGHRIAGLWGLLVMIIGILGNLLTLIAIPYAK